ncbi:hypothetical protein [Streptomyces luteireticuli]|uniref:hypothetical protein n=1 Tax=Streptomyces luteireticuli TaxID=173858 RepID=UPI003558BC63
MPQTTLLDFEIGYRGRDGRRPLAVRTVTGASPQDAVRLSPDVLRGLGVGGPAGFQLLDLQIEDLAWEPRVPLAFPVGPGPQLDRDGLPVIGNKTDWRFRAVLTVGHHPQAYIGPRPDERWRTELWMRPVLPISASLRPSGALPLRARLGDGSVVDADEWAAYYGLTRTQAVRVLAECGLEAVAP